MIHELDDSFVGILSDFFEEEIELESVLGSEALGGDFDSLEEGLGCLLEGVAHFGELLVEVWNSVLWHFGY